MHMNVIYVCGMWICVPAHMLSRDEGKMSGVLLGHSVLFFQDSVLIEPGARLPGN